MYVQFVNSRYKNTQLSKSRVSVKEVEREWLELEHSKR